MFDLGFCAAAAIAAYDHARAEEAKIARLTPEEQATVRALMRDQHERRLREREVAALERIAERHRDPFPALAFLVGLFVGEVG